MGIIHTLVRHQASHWTTTSYSVIPLFGSRSLRYRPLMTESKQQQQGRRRKAGKSHKRRLAKTMQPLGNRNGDFQFPDYCGNTWRLADAIKSRGASPVWDFQIPEINVNRFVAICILSDPWICVHLFYQTCSSALFFVFARARKTSGLFLEWHFRMIP